MASASGKVDFSSPPLGLPSPAGGDGARVRDTGDGSVLLESEAPHRHPASPRLGLPSSPQYETELNYSPTDSWNNRIIILNPCRLYYFRDDTRVHLSGARSYLSEPHGLLLLADDDETGGDDDVVTEDDDDGGAGDGEEDGENVQHDGEVWL